MTYIDYMNQLWRSALLSPMLASEIALYAYLVNESNKRYWKLDAANEELANIGKDYRTLLSKYKYLVLQWNEMKQQPEIIEAMVRVEKRKTEEMKVKREEQARQYRYQGVIDRFISEGHEALKSFSKTKRIDFNEQESNAIFYGIMATA